MLIGGVILIIIAIVSILIAANGFHKKTSTSVSSAHSSPTKSKVSSSNSEPSNIESSSTVPSSYLAASQEVNSSTETSGMNLTQIAAGNFSSIAGTWRNEEGKEFVFTNTGLSAEYGKIEDSSIGDDGTLSAGVRAGMTGYGMTFIPKGISYSHFSDRNGNRINDPSDTSQDRIIAGQTGPTSNAEVFYKVK